MTERNLIKWERACYDSIIGGFKREQKTRAEEKNLYKKKTWKTLLKKKVFRGFLSLFLSPSLSYIRLACHGRSIDWRYVMS